jgi:hypothetical protein
MQEATIGDRGAEANDIVAAVPGRGQGRMWLFAVACSTVLKQNVPEHLEASCRNAARRPLIRASGMSMDRA